MSTILVILSCYLLLGVATVVLYRCTEDCAATLGDVLLIIAVWPVALPCWLSDRGFNIKRLLAYEVFKRLLAYEVFKQKVRTPKGAAPLNRIPKP